MSQSIPVEILSDDEQGENAASSPLPSHTNKKRRKEQYDESPTVLILDDDPTPQKPNQTTTPSFVPETPMSDAFKSDVSIVKCTTGFSNSTTSAPSTKEKLSGISGLICLESENDSESGCEWDSRMEDEIMGVGFVLPKQSEVNSIGTANLLPISGDTSTHRECSSRGAVVHQVYRDNENKSLMLEQVSNAIKQKHSNNEVDAVKKNCKDEAIAKKKKLKEEKMRLIEERKLKKEQEKLQKEALKAESAKMKALQKEKQKWEKGMFALKSIVAEIDAKVVELGSVGGHLLTRFAEKGINFRIVSNPIERSILWKMTIPDQISQISSKDSEVRYVLLVYEAEEFCNLVIDESLMDHVSKVQSHYPSYTICYLTNKLMAYINKREQGQYKNPSNNNVWRRPAVEEVLSKFATHFTRVRSRQCIDEAELAEHVTGLTCSLATCQFRPKLTRLSVNANGSTIQKDVTVRNLIKKSVWLRALIAIPKVQPRFAVAIWKKYPTMRSLLSIYMDPSKSVHEKEFLLEDLKTEGLLGNEDRRLGEICSKRVYRILMARSGSIKTDDVEDGADLFRCQSS